MATGTTALKLHRTRMEYLNKALTAFVDSLGFPLVSFNGARGLAEGFPNEAWKSVNEITIDVFKRVGLPNQLLATFNVTLDDVTQWLDIHVGLTFKDGTTFGVGNRAKYDSAFDGERLNTTDFNEELELIWKEFGADMLKGMERFKVQCDGSK